VLRHNLDLSVVSQFESPNSPATNGASHAMHESSSLLTAFNLKFRLNLIIQPKEYKLDIKVYFVLFKMASTTRHKMDKENDQFVAH
jgi:hypothetical protein